MQQLELNRSVVSSISDSALSSGPLALTLYLRSSSALRSCDC